MRVPLEPAQNIPNEGIVLTKATIRAAQKLGVSQKVLAHIIGLSESMISRMNKGSYHLERETGKPFELAILFVRLYRSLDAIVGGDEKVAASWMSNDNTELAARPIDLIQSIQGLFRVINYLDTRRAHI